MKVTDIPSEAITAVLDRMVTTVKEQEDPVELKEYRALFKKRVPFNLRGYVIAHMIKALVRDAAAGSGGNGGGRSEQRRQQRRTAAVVDDPPVPPRRDRRAEPRRRPRREPAPIASGQRRLFFSIGRNRRVQPDDLVELISAAVAIERSQFGDIRVLDSYSFVEVPEAVAEDAIAALSGTSFKGRRITVDFARAKN